ncbi:Nucleosomal histone H3-Lys79 methylase [Elasticomyces elasticus]|nr:Nucleosomal histone H3-Lys79 methylase [Elasticomyces elasticus]
MSLFGNAAGPKPIVRKVSVPVVVKDLRKKASTPSLPRGPPADRFKPSKTPYSESVKRRRLTEQGRQAQSRLRNATQSKRRKTSTPSTPVAFSDDSSSDADHNDGSSDISRTKRARSSPSSVEPDPLRKISDLQISSVENVEALEIIHGKDLTAGERASKYSLMFDIDAETSTAEVELQYPCVTRPERFELVSPLEHDGYTPIDDIKETMIHVCKHYLTPSQSARFLNDDTGIERRVGRAWQSKSADAFRSVVNDYNAIITLARTDGSISAVLDRTHRLSLDWVKRILDQVYARTVSPHVETLRAYQAGSDFVYGELLPRFVSEIFEETRIKSDQVFIDLGSGVGNVVLQAALQIGCESWGCEIMPNPCRLAALQAKEFPARCKMWGLNVGAVHLLQGDFLENAEIGEVLKRADVVLVNNQVFGPTLNSKLIDKFLDLKDGCQIVSLKSFVPDGYEMAPRNQDNPINLLNVRKKEYYSGCVSWTDQGGNYYIAKKDPTALIAFKKSWQRVGRR